MQSIYIYKKELDHTTLKPSLSLSFDFDFIHSFNCQFQTNTESEKYRCGIEFVLCAQSSFDTICMRLAFKFKYHFAATLFNVRPPLLTLLLLCYSAQFTIQHRMKNCIHKQLNCNANWIKFRSVLCIALSFPLALILSLKWSFLFWIRGLLLETLVSS